MATWDDVDRLALRLPGVTEHASYGGLRAWRVKDRNVAWERPLGPADRAALADAAPDRPVLGVRVADVGVKEALVAAEPGVCFTIPHFDGYPAVLVRLDVVPVEVLEELLTEAWLARAPKRLVAEHAHLRGPAPA